MSDLDYYQIFGLTKEASTSQIKQRYRELAHEHHPDHNGDKVTMASVNEAYRILSDPRLRFQYNKSLTKPISPVVHYEPTPYYPSWTPSSSEKVSAKKRNGRHNHKLAWGIVALLIFIGIGASGSGQSTNLANSTTPNQSSSTPMASGSNNTKVTQSSNNRVLGSNSGTTSTPSTYKTPICTYQSIPYKTTYKYVSWLNAGQTSAGIGFDGSEKICNSGLGGAPLTTVLYTPTDKVINIGTYVAPTYSYSTPSYSGYTNSDGNYIPSPNYSGSTIGGYSPTYTCNDGTYSYSQHASGSCSSHGGIAH